MMSGKELFKGIGGPCPPPRLQTFEKIYIPVCALIKRILILALKFIYLTPP